MAVVGVPASRVAEQASSRTAAPTVPLPSIADATAVLDLSIMNSTGPVKQRERSSALTWDIPAVYGVTELAPGLQGDAAKAFQKPASLHLAAIVQQLLRVGGIDADAAIVGIIVGLAESAAASLSPSALTAAGDINPCHYLKVKKVLGAHLQLRESSVVHGVACRKNVAHKRMPKHVAQPRVMLVRGALERPGDTLSSFDSLLDQERKQLHEMVDFIASFKPHVLLVEKSVARFAQELLLAHNISLVLNVKPEVLERLARSLDIEVASSVDALSTRNVGFCKEFDVETYASGASDSSPSSPRSTSSPASQVFSPVDGSAGSQPTATAVAPKTGGTLPKPLMLFRGCPRPLGVTILLCGANIDELQILKQISMLATYAAYHAKLEASFLSELMLGIAVSGVAASDLSSTKDEIIDEIGTAVADSANRVRISRGDGPILSPSAHISHYEELGMAPQSLDDFLKTEDMREPDTPTPDASGGNGDATTAAPESSGAVGDVAASPTAQSGAVLGKLSRIEKFTSILQELRLTISCKNPLKGTLCEPPHGYRMRLYDGDDLSLGAFMASAVPPDRKCPNPACGDGAQLHLRSFMRGNGLVTLSSVRLADENRLPDGQTYFWVRPLRVTGNHGVVHRVALSRDAACLSFAHYLSLLLDGRDLVFRGRNLQSDYVRFLATGSIVLCLHYSRVSPYLIVFPLPSLMLNVERQFLWLRNELMEVTEEYDELLTMVESQVQEHVARAADPGGDPEDKWTSTFRATRSLAMLMLQQLRAELDARSVKCSDGLQTVPFVWEINRLRRSLSWMVQRWVALIGKLPSATSVFPIPEELESPTADRTDAGQSVEMRNLREAPTSKVRDVASGAGREAETAPARTLTHRRNYSGSVAGQFTTAFQVEGTPPDVQRQIQYSAPHLTAGPAMSEGQATMDRAGPADAPIIPMGLVARYVSMYEDASRPSAPSRPTSPKSSAQLSGAKSWNAKDWVESRRRSLAEERERGPSIVNFEIRAPLQSAGKLRQTEGNLAQWLARRGQQAGSLSEKLEELSRALDELPTLTVAAEAESNGRTLHRISSGDERSHFEEWAKIIPELPVNEAGVQAPTTQSAVSGEAKATATGVETLSEALSSVHALRWPSRSLLPAGRDGLQVSVFDDEPTSTIAYALASGAYKQYVAEAMASVIAPAGADEVDGGSTAEAARTGDVTSGDSEVSNSAPESKQRQALYSESALHCHFTVQDVQSVAPATFQVTAYYAPQFHEFRELFMEGGEASFLASIGRCVRWESKGGKSNVYFAKTRDDRFIVKQLSKPEKQSILEFIPAYFRYMGSMRETQQESCLARILGVFQVSVQYQGSQSSASSPFGAKDGTLELLIMENFFYGRTVHRVYDLKGSERDRYAVDDPKTSGTVLLDENLKEVNLSSPTVVGPAAFSRLQKAVWSDTGFLSNVGVMDYSLLVGVDKKKHELVIGIIDFIRQFTFDKALEMYVKKTGLLGGGGKNPTVLSPRHYSTRFRSAMNTWFTAVPVDGEDVDELDACAST